MAERNGVVVEDCLEKDWSENGTKHNAAAWEWWDRVGRPKTWLAPMVGQVHWGSGPLLVVYYGNKTSVRGQCICVGARD